MSKRDLLNFRDLSREELVRIFALASGLKRKQSSRFPIHCWHKNAWR
jgi:ornithine carbamoyltransferase